MENQHQKIKGYRDLTQAEIDAMNEVKALAEQAGALVDKLRLLINPDTLAPMIDQRWLNIGTTELQNGFMAVTRAIARPTTF